MILAAWYHTLLAVLFAFLAILLMGVILLQRGKGAGLSGAFGGAGGHTAFGAKTGDVLTWATIIIAGVLLLYILVLNFVFVPFQAPGAPSVAPTPVSTTPPAAPETPAPDKPAGKATGETTPATDGGGGDAPLIGIFGEQD